KQLVTDDRLVPFWLTPSRTVDTRLSPERPERSEFRFGPDLAQVRVRLIYRRAWQDVAASKGWPDNETVVLDQKTSIDRRAHSGSAPQVRPLSWPPLQSRDRARAPAASRRAPDSGRGERPTRPRCPSRSVPGRAARDCPGRPDRSHALRPAAGSARRGRLRRANTRP